MQRAAVLAGVFAAAVLAAVAPVAGQAGFEFSLGTPMTQAQPGLRTIDDERLFRLSEFGQRVAAEIEAASATLEAENIRLLEELTTREDELTQMRAEMSVEEFRAAAAAFDTQAETARREQAEKRQRLVQFEEAERRRFFGQIAPVLEEKLAELGGQVLIDARAVIISAPGTDMTDDAIEAMDAAIGDGGAAPFPLELP